MGQSVVNSLGATGVDRVAKRTLGQMHKQVTKDVFLSLNREPFVVCVRVVNQLRVQVGPNRSGDFAAEFKDAKARVSVTSLAILELVDVQLIFLGDHAL